MSYPLPSRYVSPRYRARRTLELLELGCRDRMPWHDESRPVPAEESVRTEAKVQVTEDVREWDYGDYEGLTSRQIRETREGAQWDIWKDGCPGGESPEDVTRRLDRLIEEIRSGFHKQAIGMPTKKEDEPAQRSDVLIVAHGHILRAFAMRWIGRQLGEGVSLLLEGKGLFLAWLWC